MLDLATRPKLEKIASRPERQALVTPKMSANLLLWMDLSSLSLGLALVCLAIGEFPSLVSIYVFGIAAILALHLQRSARQYDINRARDPANAAARMLGSWGLAATISLAPYLLYNASYVSGIAEELAWIMAGAGILAILARILAARLIGKLLRQGYWRSRVVVMGGGEHGRRLIKHLHEGERPIEIVGLFDDRFDRLPSTVASVPVLGGLDDLITFARSYVIDEIIVALPKGADKRLSEWFQKLAVLPLQVTHCQDVPTFAKERELTSVYGLPASRLSTKPLEGWGYVLKALEDRIIAAVVLVLVSPLMLAIGLAVKFTSKGPILFRQKRYGFNNNEIEVLKFRSMRMHEGPLEQARRHDPRITWLGRILRRTSLDELPQLINVLKGDMSLVGPRPHAVAHNEHYARSIDHYLCRHRVKPGITGWAQVNGWRGETDTIEKMEARVAHDLEYIARWSLLFDFKIMAWTLIVGFKHPNAY